MEPLPALLKSLRFAISNRDFRDPLSHSHVLSSFLNPPSH